MKHASRQKVLAALWKVVETHEVINGRRSEDVSIFTVDDEEVVGCSEWMRADRVVFDHIVFLHNSALRLKS